jgi:hypothetical protein
MRQEMRGARLLPHAQRKEATLTDEEEKGLTDEEKGYAIGQILGEVNPDLSSHALATYLDVFVVVCTCQDRPQFLYGLGRGYENAASSQRKRQEHATRHREQRGAKRHEQP